MDKIPKCKAVIADNTCLRAAKTTLTCDATHLKFVLTPAPYSVSKPMAAAASDASAHRPAHPRGALTPTQPATHREPGRQACVRRPHCPHIRADNRSLTPTRRTRVADHRRLRRNPYALRKKIPLPQCGATQPVGPLPHRLDPRRLCQTELSDRRRQVHDWVDQAAPNARGSRVVTRLGIARPSHQNQARTSESCSTHLRVLAVIFDHLGPNEIAQSAQITQGAHPKHYQSDPQIFATQSSWGPSERLVPDWCTPPEDQGRSQGQPSGHTSPACGCETAQEQTLYSAKYPSSRPHPLKTAAVHPKRTTFLRLPLGWGGMVRFGHRRIYDYRT